MPLFLDEDCDHHRCGDPQLSEVGNVNFIAKAVVLELARLHVDGFVVEARQRFLDDAERRFACASIQVPNHSFEVVMVVDDVCMKDVLIALVAYEVVQRAVIGLDGANRASAHAADYVDRVFFGFPAFLASEPEEDVSILVPGVEVLVLGDGVYREVNLVEFQSCPLLRTNGIA